MGFLYRIAEWIMRLAYVNLLWILFTVMGLIVAGVFPATAGLYTVTRQWLIKDTDTVPVWKTFWGAYRSEFIKANILGYVFLLIGWIIFVDLKFFQSQGGIIFLFLSYAFLIVLIVYMVMWLFLFPVLVHYQLKTFQYLKQTFFIIMLRPLDAIMSVAGFVAVYYLMLYVPVLIIFFGVSTLAFVTMWVGIHAFNKLQLKIEARKQKEESSE